MGAVVIGGGIVYGILLFWFVWLVVELKVVIWYRFDAIRVLFVELSLGYVGCGSGDRDFTVLYCAVLCCAILYGKGF